MVVVLGVNAGFVTVAPTADPNGGSTSTVDNSKRANRDTSPIGALTVTEIGWWCNNATEEANFEVGIYDHNAGDDEPLNVVGSLSQTNAKGTGSGWKVANGLNISIDAETIYWIAFALTNTSTGTQTDFNSIGGTRKTTASGGTLPDPFGTNFPGDGFFESLYALVTVEEPSNINPKIKISGSFSTKPIKVKIGGTFVEKTLKVKVSGTFQ